MSRSGTHGKLAGVKRIMFAGVALGCVAALTGCGVRPGAAATVGSSRIGIDDLGSRTDAVYTGTIASENTRPAIQLKVLDEMIQSRIDESLAAHYGITVTDEQVRAFLAGTEASNKLTDATLESTLLSQSTPAGYQGLTDFFHDYLLQQALRTQLVKQEKPSVAGLQALYTSMIGTYVNSDVAVIVVSGQAAANAVVAQTKAKPTTFAAVAMAQSLDTSSKANGGDEGVKPKGTYIPAIENAIYASKAGAILGPFALNGGAFAVLHVISVTNTSFQDALPALLKAALDPSGTVAQAALKVSESEEAATLGVWINPRFGEWGGAESLTAKTAPDVLSTVGAASSSDVAANGGEVPSDLSATESTTAGSP